MLNYSEIANQLRLLETPRSLSEYILKYLSLAIIKTNCDFETAIPHYIEG